LGRKGEIMRRRRRIGREEKEGEERSRRKGW
jgi:hypothetical protein